MGKNTELMVLPIAVWKDAHRMPGRADKEQVRMASAQRIGLLTLIGGKWLIRILFLQSHQQTVNTTEQ